MIDISKFESSTNARKFRVKSTGYSNDARVTILNTTINKDFDNGSAMSFRTNIYNQGITSGLNAQEIERVLRNPESNKKTLEQISSWYYVTNGDVFQLYDLARILSSLDSKIGCFEKDGKYKKNSLLLNKELKKLNHKELTRDVIGQLVNTGTLVGLWLGDEKEGYYPIIFDDLEYIFPAYRERGKWTIWFDLAYLNRLSDIERKVYINNLKPFVTENDYAMYLKDSSKCRYIQFPIERSICLRTHTLYRNQRFGIPWCTQAIGDLGHKKKLKDLEKSVANKIINATAVLTIGDEANPNLKLGKNTKTKVFGGVKKALTENEEEGGVAVVAVPEFAKLEFQKIGKEPLDPDKFESVNADVQNGLGYAKGVITGNEGTYASNNLSLTIFYMKIGEILEGIESEIYNKFINLILDEKYEDVYYLEYEKSMPVDKKTKLAELSKLESQGYSIKPLLETLGIDYLEYIEQSKFEIKTLKLREEITPPLNSNVLSGKNGKNVGGRVEDTTNLNDNTVENKNIGGNQNPKPSTT